MGMLAATRPVRRLSGSAVRARATPTAQPPNRPTALLFRGCVMEGLFSHVHDATARTLSVNGYETREVSGPAGCGALHAHAGLLDEARALARTNVNAFGDGEEPIVVNSAGCGALMKEYGHLLGDARSERFGRRVRDVTELLAGDAMKGPVAGAPLDLHVAYDPPCHLLHAQGVAVPPLKLFAAIPLLELVPVPGAAECCGSAGLFTLLEPEMSRAVLNAKLERIRAAAPQVVATGNPGCLMQLAAGLDVWLADLRHHGESAREPRRGAWTFEDWVLRDTPTLVARVREETDGAPLAWVGHSAGGAAGLCWLARVAAAAPLGAIVTLGTPGPRRLGPMRRALAAATMAMSRALGQLPARAPRLGHGDEAAEIIAGWLEG